MKQLLKFTASTFLLGIVIFISCKKAPPCENCGINKPEYICGDTARPRINARLIPVGTLSEERSGMSVVAAGNKIFFAGSMSSAVDIFDINTGGLTTASLSVRRDEIATGASGNKVIFAGGEISDGTFPTDAVDIYDVVNNSWTTARLSAPGHLIGAAAAGNKVFFVGGRPWV